MAYANALKPSEDRYIGKSTIIASIKHLPMTLEEIATELKKQKTFTIK